MKTWYQNRRMKWKKIVSVLVTFRVPVATRPLCPPVAPSSPPRGDFYLTLTVPSESDPCRDPLCSLPASGGPSTAHIPSCSAAPSGLPTALTRRPGPSVAFPHHFPGLEAAPDGLVVFGRPYLGTGLGVPLPGPSSPLCGRPTRRCCRVAAWSLPPSPRGGPRRTPFPRASSSRSRSAPRRRRSQWRRQARPSTGAARTERAKRRPRPLRPLEAASRPFRGHAVCFRNVLLLP